MRKCQVAIEKEYVPISIYAIELPYIGTHNDMYFNLFAADI